MMFLFKIFTFTWAALILALLIVRAPLAISADYDEFSASQKGVEIIGVIVNNQDSSQNVVLLKNLSTSQTYAKRVGSALILDDSYSITSIQKEFIEIQGASRKIRLYKFGFEPAVVAKPKSFKREVPTKITGTFKEEGFEREDGNIKITEEYRKKILEKDLPKILMQAAAEPKMDANGNILGFALYDIEPDSIYAKAGLSDGDVIKSINGEELNSPQGAIKLLNSLRGASGFNVIVERGGADLPLNLDVK